MLNLAVVFGSRTCEHEVSIISALQLIKNIDTQKYNPIPIYISSNGEWYVGEKLTDLKTFVNFEQSKSTLTKVELDLYPSSGALFYFEEVGKVFKKQVRKIYARIDCVIPVLHGMNGEDGTIQGLFELANIPYASSRVSSCAIGMDKVIMKSFFRGNGYPVLDDIWFKIEQWQTQKHECIKNIESQFSYPLIVKPANLGSSIGVSIVQNKEELTEGIELAFEFDRKILIEPAIVNPIELNCSVLGDSREANASEIEMPITGGNLLSFMEKYMQGSKGSKGMASLKRILPAPIDEELKFKIQGIALDVFKTLDCKGVVRIDFMLNPQSNDLFITEINMIPGSMSFYLWEKTGVSYPLLIDKLVDIAMYAHAQKLALNYNFSSDILKSNLSGKVGSKGLKK